MKQWIQRAARKYGYEIRKAPFPGFLSVPVFDLALHYLIITRGEQLTLIQVGANAGREDDPIRPYLLKYPWKGVLIEPQPDVFEKLKENYAALDGKIAFENVAISTSLAPLQLYRLPPSATPSDSIVSFDPKIVAKQSNLRSEDMVAISVPTARLDDIVMKHGLTDVNILLLDTEGYDWDVIQSLDLVRTAPLLIRFEQGHLPPKAIGNMIQHLNRHNYSVYYGGYESDSVALRNDFIQP